jgi:hypothetical protein
LWNFVDLVKHERPEDLFGLFRQQLVPAVVPVAPLKPKVGIVEDRAMCAVQRLWFATAARWCSHGYWGGMQISLFSSGCTCQNCGGVA